MRYEMLRPEEICKKQEQCPLIFLPLGPLEWHGPHLPFGTDGLLAEQIAQMLSARLGGVVLPTLYVGGSGRITERQRAAIGLPEDGEDRNGIDFHSGNYNSFYLRPETLHALLEDYLNAMLGQDYRLIVIVSGHGGAGHTTVLDKIAEKFSDESHQVIILPAVPPLSPEDENSGHATVLETASMMYLFPERVNCSVLPPISEQLSCANYGIVDDVFFFDPDHASYFVQADPRTTAADVGKRYVVHALQVHEEKIRQLLQKLNIG